MYRKLIVIIDPYDRTKLWEEKFQLKFNKHGHLYVENNFICDRTFVKEISNESLSFYANGYYFTRDDSSNNLSDKSLIKLLASTSMEEIPLEFINGAYTIVVIKDEQAIIFNDFMGLQTLYKYEYKGAQILSTSLRILSRSFDIEKDLEAIREYIVSGTLFSGRSGLKDVSLLPPASLCRVTSQGIIFSNYSSFSNTKEFKSDYKECVESTQNVLESSIKRLYKKNVQYSLSLSGGMDSRLIYCNWPDRQKLLTETSGEETSDFLKAREMVTRYGDLDKHTVEKLSPGNIDGLDEYYKRCDNPLLAKSHHNMRHVEWKRSRGSLLHLSGVGGEMIGGENLYLTRKPLSVIMEAFLPYSYHEVSNTNKAKALKLLFGYDKSLQRYLGYDDNDSFVDKIIAESIFLNNSLIGETKYLETYVERIRTIFLAQAGYYLLGSLNFHDYMPISPYNDQDLIRNTCQYEPKLRELRKTTIKILKNYDFATDIPIDTTHLNITRPYALHKIFRVIRMVMNIGFQKKVPFIQKGDSPKQRFDPYFNKQYPDYRTFVNKKILDCEVLNNKYVRELLNNLENVYGAEYYTRHGIEQHIRRMLRISYFMEI
jgi:hypothetical protein